MPNGMRQDLRKVVVLMSFMLGLNEFFLVKYNCKFGMVGFTQTFELHRIPSKKVRAYYVTSVV